MFTIKYLFEIFCSKTEPKTKTKKCFRRKINIERVATSEQITLFGKQLVMKCEDNKRKFKPEGNIPTSNKDGFSISKITTLPNNLISKKYAFEM